MNETMMDHSMMMPMGPTLFGFELGTLLMIASGVFYIICAIFVYRSYKQEKTELIGALLAFLIYQAISMFFMGVEMLTHNMLFSNIAGFAVLVGSAYMLKFPFSQFSKGVRQTVFFVVLIVALGLFVWFMQTPERQMDLMTFVLWYDMITNGIIAGGSIIIYGLKVAEAKLRRKAVTGGSGVLTCCIAANGFMLTGAMITSSVFAFIAPLLILGSINLGKNKSKGQEGSVQTTA